MKSKIDKETIIWLSVFTFLNAGLLISVFLKMLETFVIFATLLFAFFIIYNEYRSSRKTFDKLENIFSDFGKNLEESIKEYYKESKW